MRYLVRPRASIAVVVLCLLGFVALVPSYGKVILHNANGQNTSLLSFPQQYGMNSRLFQPVFGTFGGRPKLDGPPREKGMVLALEYRGWRQPYVEDILSEWKILYDPAAVIYYHNNDTRFWGDGFPEYINTGAFASGVNYPVVNMNSEEWSLFERLTASPNTSLNMTIDSDGISPWRIQKDSGAYYGHAVITGAFCIINIVLASLALSKHPQKCSRSISTLCLTLEIVAHVIRFFYALDPSGPWKLWPYPVEIVLLTLSIPVSLISMVLLTLYWQELVDFSSLEVSSVLSRSKIPAIIIVCLTLGTEVASSAVRAADVRFEAVVIVNNIIYLVILVILIAHVSYVSFSVFRFFKRLPRLNRTQRALRAFSMRSAASIIGLLVLLSAALALLTSGTNIYGHFYALFCVSNGLNFIGLMQILAFLNVNDRGRTNSSSSSKSDLEVGSK